MSLNFSKEIYDDIVVEIIELTRATLQEAQEFKNILLEDINKNYLKFVVDLKDCEFIDSTFLSTLVIIFCKFGSTIIIGIDRYSPHI